MSKNKACFLSCFQGNILSKKVYIQHEDAIKWKHFPHYWPFVQEIHQSLVNFPPKGQWRGALMFSLICTLNKWLSKQSWGWWYKMPSHSLWRHCNECVNIDIKTERKCHCVEDNLGNLVIYVKLILTNPSLNFNDGITILWLTSLEVHWKGPLLLTWFNFNPSMDK